MDSTTTPQFEIGDKVDQTYSNHVEGTVVAVFTNKSASGVTPSRCPATAPSRSPAPAASPRMAI